MLRRRSWLGGCLGLLAGCCRQNRTDVDTSEIRLHELSFGPEEGGPQRVVVLVPTWANEHHKLPLVIALHGRGEANRGLDVGAWAWVRDYGLDRSAARLRQPPLTRDDYLGLITPSHLDRLNDSLRTNPWRGLVVACPYTPDILGHSDLDAAVPMARFVKQYLIPKVRKRFPVIDSRQATGIDGVSLGGRMALLVATLYPEQFGAVGTLQAAFRDQELPMLVQRIRWAWQQPVHPMALRILTSDHDPFRPTLEKLASMLQPAPQGFAFDLVAGPHDIDFNRGPGGIEMLRWQERVLVHNKT